jgi:hypothetical protein
MPQQLPSTAGDWQRVLTHVEQALVQAVEIIQLREQSLTAVGSAPHLPQLDWQRLQERQDALQACPRLAGQHLAELETSLREGEEALRQWLARAETLRRQLAMVARHP